MSDQQIRVTFEPQGRSVFVLPGTKLLEVAGRVGMTIETPCGGAGVCGKCRVQVTGGACEPSEADRNAFSQEQLREGWRLACQTAVRQDTLVHVPQGSLFGNQQQIFVQAQAGAAEEVLPAVRKVYVELPEPTLGDHVADLMRLERQVGPVKADLALLQKLPVLLRNSGFKGTAVLTDRRLIDFEPGDTTAECYGAAFDIGTTTLVASLLDMRSGEELALVSLVNPQVGFGDDVLSRIERSGSREECLAQLRDVVVAAVSEMIDQLCEQANVRRRRIYELSFAGNTTMEHLLCGINVAPLGHVPFVPAHARGLMLPSADLGISIHERGAAYVFPVIGGFVGGDTVAGMLATKLPSQDSPVLLVDIGTNGEIVLAHDGRLWAASTAAGPAFEGARISCGMRAASGAIEKVVFDSDVRCSVIGNTAAIGLCGSGLIDAAAEMLSCGIILPDGRMLRPEELPAALPPGLRRRVRTPDKGHVEFLLADPPGQGRPGVTLTQRDIRELQLAAGAIRAGISILLRGAGLKTTDLKKVLIAGGFGSFIRRSKAQRIGLLPADIDHRRITYVGNASLNGAKWALLSTEARGRAENYARAARHVQLSEDPHFQVEFAEAMVFPRG